MRGMLGESDFGIVASASPGSPLKVVNLSTGELTEQTLRTSFWNLGKTTLSEWGTVDPVFVSQLRFKEVNFCVPLLPFDMGDAVDKIRGNEEDSGI